MLSATIELVVGLGFCAVVAVEAAGNPCKDPSDWNPDAKWGDESVTCGQFRPGNPSFFPASVDECGDKDSMSGKQRVMMAASFCCGGKPASEVCGALGNPCKDPSDWNPDAKWGDDSETCGRIRAGAPSFFPASADECGDGPDEDGRSGLQRVSIAASFCCGGKPASEVCGAPVNPCATTDAFKPGNTLFGQSCVQWSGYFPRTADECNLPTANGEFTKDIAMNIGFRACCDSGDMAPTCPARPECFQKFLQCFFEHEANADSNSAEAALKRNEVQAGLDDDGSGDCFQAIQRQVGGAEGCCKPIKSVIECVTSAIGDDWWTCPGLGEKPFEVSQTEAMNVVKAYQTGGYCTAKPWEMGKVAKLAYLQKQLKAARDKKAESGCDDTCKKAYDEQIDSLEASVSKANSDTTTTTTTTTIAEASAAFRFSLAWAAVVAAAGLVAVVL